MKSGLYFAVFMMGAAVGAASAWRYAKKKYEKIAQEEIDSVKAVFAKREVAKAGEKVTEGFHDGVRQAKDKPDIKQYTSVLQNEGYIDSDGQEGGDGCVKDKYPYVISPEEFGEFEDYEKISLTYYADGVLADDSDSVVDNVGDVVGDALDHFGEYEDDSVFVRCDERRCDYEILLDQRTFVEAAGRKPVTVEVR